MWLACGCGFILGVIFSFFFIGLCVCASDDRDPSLCRPSKPSDSRQLELELRKALLELLDRGVDGVEVGPGDTYLFTRYTLERVTDQVTGRYTVKSRPIGVDPLNSVG